jgi:acetyl esterase/lipase
MATAHVNVQNPVVYFCQFFTGIFLFFASVSPSSAQLVVPVYPGAVPNSRPNQVQETSITLANGGVRISSVVQPTLTLFLPPPHKATGTAVIVCPGGGYVRLSIDHEGYDVARRLNELGVAAFVLKYRLPNEATQLDKATAPLQDAQQALRLVRQRAAEWKLSPERIGIMGFSAGGHLAASAGTRFAQAVGEKEGAAAVRPSFLVLVYPVISFADSLAHAGSRSSLLGASPSPARLALYSCERQVSAQTPPTFLVHAQDDKSVPVQNSLAFYQACTRRGVPAELHLYPKGGHGFGLHNKTTPDDWTERLRNWLEANGWLSR